eukprot:jgi/Hompol1/4829/HPOL_003989-RA
MADMTEEQKLAIKKEIREQTRRIYTISYGIVGGTIGAVLPLLDIMHAFETLYVYLLRRCTFQGVHQQG